MVRSAIRPLLVILGAAGFTLLIATAGAAADDSASFLAVSSRLIAAQVGDAQEIYDGQCAPCHGASGEGGIGPALEVTDLTDAEVIEIILEGRNAMPAFGPTLDTAQIEGVVALLDGFAGAGIYAEQCAPCHGASGEGGVAPSLQASMMSVAERTEVITEGEAEMPAFGPTLSDEAIAAVVAYLTQLTQSDHVGSAIFAEQCAPCHGASGEGGIATAVAGTDLTMEERLAVLTTGVEGMPSFAPTLSEDELASVAAFLDRIGEADAGTASDTGGDADADAGAVTYASLCAGCHGAAGEGGVGPALTDLTAGEEELIALITDGQGAMPGFGGQLGPEEIQQVVAALGGLGQTDAGDSGLESTTAADTRVGAVIYEGRCAGCHGANGEGGAGPSLAGTDLGDAELIAIITDGRGGMPAYGDQLSEQEIQEVAASILTIGAPLGEAGSSEAIGKTGPAVFGERCAACHGAEGYGDIGPSLRGLSLTVNELVAVIYGGHDTGMPAFEGRLEADEALTVAKYVVALEAPLAGAETPDDAPGVSVEGWLVAAGLVGLAFLISALGILSSRKARRQEPEVGEAPRDDEPDGSRLSI